MTSTHRATGSRSKRAAGLCFIASGVSFLTGIGIFTWQVSTFLRMGRWIPVSCASMIATIGVDLTPLYRHAYWKAVAPVARFFFDDSAAAGFVLVGFLFLLISSSLEGWRRRPPQGDAV